MEIGLKARTTIKATHCLHSPIFVLPMHFKPLGFNLSCLEYDKDMCINYKIKIGINTYSHGYKYLIMSFMNQQKKTHIK